MKLRRLSLGAACALAGVGIALPRLGVAGSGVVILPAGFLLFTLALAVGFRRLFVAVDPAPVVAPELQRATPVPGSDVDERLDEVRDARAGAYRRDRLRDRLASAARDLLVARADVDPDTVDDWLAAGEWTDDGVVAGFLAGEPLPDRSLRARLRAPFRGDGYVAALSRTVDELLAVAGVDGTPAEPSADERPPGEAVTEVGVRRTHRWVGIAALPAATLALGLLFETPALVLGSTVGIGYAAYASRSPSIDASLSVERTLRPRRPDPGQAVTVSLTVTNEGDRAVTDLRVVDGVPPALTVSAGAARRGAVLPAGADLTVTYRVRARRGVHEFDPVTLRIRPLSETTERVRHSDTAAEIVCRPRLESPDADIDPAIVTEFAGQVFTETGGAGVAFHGAREYRRRDPSTRIDWDRYARTGALTTITYTEERAGRAVIAVDARTEAHVSPAPGDPTARDRSADAAAALFAAFHAQWDRVGLVAAGPTPCWLRPEATTAARVREMLTTHPAFRHEPPTESCYLPDWLDAFRARFRRPTHVVFLSPLCDDGAVRLVRRLELHGHPVAVVSPDPTTAATLGGRIVRLERAIRVLRLRNAGVRVVDWGNGESLSTALARGARR